MIRFAKVLSANLILGFGIFLNVTFFTDYPAPSAVERPNAEGSPEWLYENYCEPKVEGEIPNSVVIAYPDSDYFIGDETYVGYALDQVFNDADTNFMIYEFCR